MYVRDMAQFTNNELWNLGKWGPVTATLDWCEANYQFSYYIAEMANTVSNLVSIAFALYGVFYAWNESLPVRYIVGLAGCAFIGLGSFAFHATLWFEAQLADELPMIYVASHGLFLLFDTEPGFALSTTRGSGLLTASLVFDVLFSWSYMVSRNPVYHQVVFASLMGATIVRTAYLLRWSIASARIPESTKSVIGTLFTTGSALFAFGFFIWNLDNIFCDTLTRWRVAIGWPAAFLLEGHAWWHVFTGTGSYLMSVGIVYLTLCIKDDHRRYGLAYTLGIPRMERLSDAKVQ